MPREREETFFAIDPGVTLCGWAAVVVPAGRTHPVAYLDAQHEDAATVVQRLRFEIANVQRTGRPLRVAIEEARWQPKLKNVAQLMQSKGVEGMLRGIAIGLGYEPIMIPATEWRQALGLGRTPTDAMVARAVAHFVSGMPKRTNCHERDALGLAVAASIQHFHASRRIA